MADLRRVVRHKQLLISSQRQDQILRRPMSLDITPNPLQQPAPGSQEPAPDDVPVTDELAAAPLLSFEVRFIDFSGRPIPRLHHKIQLTEGQIKSEFFGRSNTDGIGIKLTECIQPNSLVELWIQKADASWSHKYKGRVSCQDMTICAVSPHIKVNLKTEIHQGTAPNTPTTKPISTHASLDKLPNAPMGSTRQGRPPDPALKTNRDKNGNPIAAATKKSEDCNGRLRLPSLGLWSWSDFKKTTSSSTTPVKSANKNEGSTTNPKQVAELVKIMEQQASWNWKELKSKYGGSVGIITALSNGSFKAPDGTKKIEQFHGKCYMSVKVGLWRAHLVEGVGGGGSPSTEARAWLLGQGFTDVTDQLPDARWAAPGDVIVYQYDETTISENNQAIATQLKLYEKEKAAYAEKLKAYDRQLAEWKNTHNSSNNDKKIGKSAPPQQPKAPQPPHSENYGHIDVRTYDGYISDAKTQKLPRANREESKKGFVPNGIYRKSFDILPTLRIRAFLKIIREWECHQESSDEARYRLLGMGLKLEGMQTFSDTIKHPFEGTEHEGKRFNPAGAYQIILSTYRLYTNGRHGIPKGFSPVIQDRIAVAIIEEQASSSGASRTALSAIRRGDIKEAVALLCNQWSSLPGGREPRKEKRAGANYTYTIDDVIAQFNKNLNNFL
mgnify:CR=1 FL=1